MLPTLVSQHVEFEGVGWKESAVDVILSSIGQRHVAFNIIVVRNLEYAVSPTCKLIDFSAAGCSSHTH